MKARVLERIQSCYFQGVSYWINYNEILTAHGNESYFTIDQAVHPDGGGHAPELFNLGKEFNTLAQAAYYAQTLDAERAQKWAEHRINSTKGKKNDP